MALFSSLPSSKKKLVRVGPPLAKLSGSTYVFSLIYNQWCYKSIIFFLFDKSFSWWLTLLICAKLSISLITKNYNKTYFDTNVLDFDYILVL